jgi:acetyl-CoA carboxylase biotin carboxylase subunit
MIKAAAGGGGKGMRLVEDESHLESDFLAAGSEASHAFSDASLYLEKYISRPRHIEIQVLADRYGNAIHLGERECSLQRRHQKVLEESPSPLVDEGLRRRMADAALSVVRSAGYINAGTVEFLVDDDRNFYFLEMNTRLQVEHPVTEAVTGIDLVREQFRIAAGEPLSIRQEDVQMRGWAMECRIYAEDPARGFFPSPGTIKHLLEPDGPGVRVDSGVYEGWEVPIHYDPLIAKLITFGADRAQAIARMRRAILEYRVSGIRTSLGFFADVLQDPEFKAGHLSTRFIDEFLARSTSPKQLPEQIMEGYALAAVLDQAEPPPTERPRADSSRNTWRMAARPALPKARPSKHRL